MLRAKAARATAEGVTRQDRWLGNVDTVGAAGLAPRRRSRTGPTRFAPAAGAAREGVSASTAHRILPKFHHKTFARWFRERGGGRLAEGHKVAFFYSCSVNYNEPQVGRDAVSVLEKNGCAVSCPEQVCCGMPYLDGGDIDARHARTRGRTSPRCCPLVEAGADIVVPQPTCSYVLKKEYPMLVPGAAAEKVAATTPDVFEYLAEPAQGRALSRRTSPAGRRARSPTRCPATCARRTWASRRATCCSSSRARRSRWSRSCTAMDGTWGMKKEYYPISLQFARKAVEEMEASAARHLRDRLHAVGPPDRGRCAGERPAHPITLLREAYGLPEER